MEDTIFSKIKISKISLWAYSLITIFFFFQLFTLSNYGIIWDEPFQHQIGSATINFLQGKTEDIKLTLPDAKYYGSFFELLNHYIGNFFISSFGMPYTDAFHILTFLFFGVGLVFFYKLTTDLFNERIALYSFLFLALSPRFTAHSVYNSKDIPVAIFILITIFFLEKTFNKRKKYYSILAGVFFGLGLATRVDVVLGTFIFFLTYTVDLVLRNKLSEVIKSIGLIIYFFLTSFIVVYITWPSLWIEPDLLFKSIYYFLHHEWLGNVLYLGKIYPAKELPWHYSLTYLFASNSLIVVIILIIGLFGSAASLVKKWDKRLLLILVWFLTPLLISLKPGSVRYDGVRHMLPAFYPLFILSAIGFDRLIFFLKKVIIFGRDNHFKNSVVCIILAWLSWQFILIFPYGDSYFNEAFQAIVPSHIEKKLEIEYWGSTYKQGVEWLNSQAEKNAEVCVPIASHLVQYYPIRQDLKFLCSKEANYLMFFPRVTFLPKDLDEVFHYSNTQPVFRISRINSDLLYIYKFSK